MRIIYFGSPRIAVAPLQALHRAGHDVVLVISGPDKRRGRGSATTPTPVKAAALELGIPVSDRLSDALQVTADLGVVVAYGRIIPVEVIDALPLVNIHFSLLPRWRGAAPIERAILAGDARTGVALMAVEESLDTGAVFRTEEIAIAPADTAQTLNERLSALGTEMLIRALEEGLGEPTPQTPDGVTYAEKLTPADRQLSAEMSVADFGRRVRIDGAWTTFRGKRLKILEIEPLNGDDNAAYLDRRDSGSDDPGGSADRHGSSHPGGSADRRGSSHPDGSADPGGAIAQSEAGTGAREPAGVFLDGAVLQLKDGSVRLVSVQPEGRPAMDAQDWARGARPAGESIGT